MSEFSSLRAEAQRRLQPTETATEETVAPATESAQPEAIAMPAQTEEVSPAGTSAAPTEAAKVCLSRHAHPG